MNKEMFYVGQMFSCKEEVLCFYREFCRMHSQPLTIRNSSEEKVVFKCRHGRKRKSMCTGQRPNQHYLFKNCMAQVNVRKSKQNYWHVTKVHLEHNHEIGKVQYIEGRKRELDQQDNNSMPDLVDAEAKDSKIAENTQDDLELMEIMSVEDTPPNNVNICEDMGSDNKMKISTDIEKFKKVSAVTQEINEIISSLDTEKFWEYIDELKNFIKLVREGKSVTLISQPPQNRKSSKGPESPESSILDQSQNFSLKFQEKIKCKGRPKRKSKS